MKTIFFGGKVYTGQLPVVEAFVIDGDHFVFAGTSAQALVLAEKHDRLVDLDGKFVCAGFNDTHMHLLNFGQTLKIAPLHEHTGSLADMLDCLKAQQFSENGWIIGRGWNQDLFCDCNRMPNRWDLDLVSTTQPVMAVRACGHAAVVNSFVLNLLGINGASEQPDGGRIVMENGQPNGILLDNAMNFVYDAIPSPAIQDLKDMILAASRKLNSYGITSCQTDDYCVFSNIPWQMINRAYQELEQSGDLSVRVYEQCNFTNLNDLKAFVESGNNTGTGSEFFRIGPLKMLGDGALGARTAFLSQPYTDDPTTCGIPVFSQEVFDEMLGYAHKNGMQSAVHTIGDACLDRVLSALEKAFVDNPRDDYRHGIVHCQITRADQLEKIAKMKLHVYAQSIFLDYDIRIVEARVGKMRSETSYSWKTLKKFGATVSNGSDCPVELPFVLGGIQCAVTRCTLHGEGPYLPNEAFSVEQALNSYTSDGAYASFEEHIKGKIAAEMLADFVILSDSPFEVPVNRIADINVIETWLGGKRVYLS